MDLAALRIFSAVVRTGGVTRAAERLHRVQSNVTTRIRQLERELGVALFIRDGKKLHLSHAGHLLLPYAEQLLALADEAQNAVRDPRPRGLFRLGAMESTAAVRLPGPLAQYHRAYPEVVLELHTGNPQELAAAILAGTLDAALVTEPVPEVPFDRAPAFVEELVIVAAAGQAPINGGAVPRCMIAFERGCPHRARLEAWYASRGEMPERTIELGSYHAMLGCVAAGMGIALLPRSVLNAFPERKRLSVHPLPRNQCRAVTLLIWRKGGASPNLEAFRQLLSGSDRTRSARQPRDRTAR